MLNGLHNVDHWSSCRQASLQGTLQFSHFVFCQRRLWPETVFRYWPLQKKNSLGHFQSFRPKSSPSIDPTSPSMTNFLSIKMINARFSNDSTGNSRFYDFGPLFQPKSFIRKWFRTSHRMAFSPISSGLVAASAIQRGRRSASKLW